MPLFGMPDGIDPPPLLYLRETGDVLELVRSQYGNHTADQITEKQAAALIRDLSQWLYRRINR
jgi:hypothetical protein